MVNCIEYLSDCDIDRVKKIHVDNDLFSHAIYDQMENLTIVKFHQNNLCIYIHNVLNSDYKRGVTYLSPIFPNTEIKCQHNPYPSMGQ